MEHVLVTDGDIQGLKQPIFLIFPTTLVIPGADSLLCRLSWHCPCPLPFACHSHHNIQNYQLSAALCPLGEGVKLDSRDGMPGDGRVGPWEGFIW